MEQLIKILLLQFFWRKRRIWDSRNRKNTMGIKFRRGFEDCFKSFLFSSLSHDIAQITKRMLFFDRTALQCSESSVIISSIMNYSRRKPTCTHIPTTRQMSAWTCVLGIVSHHRITPPRIQPTTLKSASGSYPTHNAWLHTWNVW